MAWCEANRVDFVFGLARNPRLVEELTIEMAWTEEEAARTGQPARRFRNFRWSTLDSWSRRRRIIGKAEWTRGEANPRFIVTSLKPTYIPTNAASAAARTGASSTGQILAPTPATSACIAAHRLHCRPSRHAGEKVGLASVMYFSAGVVQS
jgi:Transposase DDE domain group 1